MQNRITGLKISIMGSTLATYHVFRQWLGSTVITDEEWEGTLEEDSTFDYQSRGIGREKIQTAIGDDQLQELGGVMEPELGVEEEVLTGSIE